MDHPSRLPPSIIDGESGPVTQVQFDFAAVIEPAPLPDEMPPTTSLLEAICPVEGPQPRQPFGEWLLAQQDRKGWIGDLAKAAKTDRDFPKRGSPDEVRKRLQQMGADGDVFEALDDAELDWASF